jgi:hypothetical protein
MAAEVPQYLKATSYDLPPKAVALGSFIESPEFPDEILNHGQIVTIDPEPSIHIQPNWKEVVEDVKKGKIGLWARFVQNLGIGAEIGVGGNNDNSQKLFFKRLETTAFHPDAAYLDEALRRSRIQMHLKHSQHAPIYMVTGIKVVKGPDATVKTSVIRARQANANIGVSATIYGASIHLGPEAEGSMSKSRTVEFGGPSDVGDASHFVFAYRLREIVFEETATGWVHTSKRYLEGALYGDDSKKKLSSGVAKVASGYEDPMEGEWVTVD